MRYLKEIKDPRLEVIGRLDPNLDPGLVLEIGLVAVLLANLLLAIYEYSKDKQGKGTSTGD